MGFGGRYVVSSDESSRGKKGAVYRYSINRLRNVAATTMATAVLVERRPWGDGIPQERRGCRTTYAKKADMTKKN